MQVPKTTSMDQVFALAKQTREPVEIVNEAGQVATIVSVPGPLPPEPIDKVRELLARPPKFEGDHWLRARKLSAYEAAGLLALLDAIREAAREEA